MSFFPPNRRIIKFQNKKTYWTIPRSDPVSLTIFTDIGNTQNKPLWFKHLFFSTWYTTGKKRKRLKSQYPAHKTRWSENLFFSWLAVIKKKKLGKWIKKKLDERDESAQPNGLVVGLTLVRLPRSDSGYLAFSFSACFYFFSFDFFSAFFPVSALLPPRNEGGLAQGEPERP